MRNNFPPKSPIVIAYDERDTMIYIQIKIIVPIGPTCHKIWSRKDSQSVCWRPAFWSKRVIVFSGLDTEWYDFRLRCFSLLFLLTCAAWNTPGLAEMRKQRIHQGIDAIFVHGGLVSTAPLVFENVRSENTFEVGSVHFETIDVQYLDCIMNGCCSEQVTINKYCLSFKHTHIHTGANLATYT